MDDLTPIISALVKANTEIENEYKEFLKKKIENSENSKEKYYLRKIIKNSEIASKTKWPLCQDTGFVSFYIDYCPYKVDILKLKDNCVEAVKKCYSDFKFRKSMIDIEGNNTKNNLPAFFYFNPVEKVKTKIGFLIKGGGSENVSGVLNLLPGLSNVEISIKILQYFNLYVNSKACPPYFIGVGIGGSIEKAVTNSKKALIDYVFSKEDDFEKNIRKLLNESNIGLFGTGFGDTVFGVKVVREASHIANNIVALSFNCHSLRRGVIEFE